VPPKRANNAFIGTDLEAPLRAGGHVALVVVGSSRTTRSKRRRAWLAICNFRRLTNGLMSVFLSTVLGLDHAYAASLGSRGTPRGPLAVEDANLTFLMAAGAVSRALNASIDTLHLRWAEVLQMLLCSRTSGAAQLLTVRGGHGARR